MATITGKLGEWHLPNAHMWSERGRELRMERIPLLDRSTRLVVLGACISVGLAAGLRRLGFRVNTHPAGHLYDSRNIRQAVEHAFGGWPERDREPIWRVKGGFVDPFAKSYMELNESEDLLLRRRAQRDKSAREMLANADVVAVFLEVIETWRNPRTGNYLLTMPHPEVFPSLGAELHRLRFADIHEDLERIHRSFAGSKARLVVASSASWLYATATANDVRSASLDCIARVNAAVSEFVEAHPEVHYFPLSDMLLTAEQPRDFMTSDGRHIHQKATDYIVQQFVRRFGADSVPVPDADLSWLLGPGDPAVATPPSPSGSEPGPAAPPQLAHLKRMVRRWVPEWALARYRRRSFR